MKPQILIYLYNYYPFESANTNVMLPILDALKTKYQVELYSANLDGTAPLNEEINGVIVHRPCLYTGPLTKAQTFAIQVYDSKEFAVQGPCKRLKKLILMVYHRLVSQQSIDRMRMTEREQTMATLMEENHYVAVITVAAPIITHFAVLPLAKNGYLKQRNIKWFAYFSDPYATFIGHTKQLGEFMQQEAEVYEWADAVFATPEIAKDNEKYRALAPYANKTHSVQLANLTPKQMAKGIVPFALNPEKINCVYVGSFINLCVRNPEYFYKVAAACGQEIEFHIVCYFENEESCNLRKRYLCNAPNIHWQERATMEECESLTCQADILINLGNLCTNQTPSKVFDYIGAGGAIVNFYGIEDDTSKHYLDRYPMHLNILGKSELDTEDVIRFTQFCHQNKGKRVPFSTVERLYADCLAKNVAQDFLQKFEAEMK